MKPVFVTRKPYSGLTRSLVIAIDVGTTFSGVSYAILDPGEVPQIHGVTRFPGQEHVAGNSKIPSILYYDKKGEVKAVGAEADSAHVQANAEDENWVKVELFKLRLRPRTMNLSMNGLRLAPLPSRKSPVHIFGDFLSYLYTCTTSFIKDTHANGSALLAHVIPHHVEFVLSHPNGWEGAQQAKMRRAAIYGRLIDDTPEGRARIRFVTEGEASLHACVLSGLATDVLSIPGRHGFLIADAGGGTLDISSYAIKGTNPLVMEEVAPPDCIFAGSVFVSRRAREFFEHKLKGCKYGTPDSLDHITRQFDEKTKRLFRDSKDTQFVPFGSPFDKDPAYGIRNGQLRLTGAEVANLFEPSIDAAFNAIKKQIEACSVGIKCVFLVGGYAASPWLFSQLQERLKAMNVVISRPDTQTSKAVADGAIGFYCDHHVSARMSKFMYGVEYLRTLDPNDPEHVERKEKLCELPSGPKLLPDAFDCILARGLKVKESTVFSRKYCTELTSLSMLRVFEVEIWCYRGGNTVPKWIERRSETFSTLCIVKADLSMLSDSAAPKQGPNGKTYWTIVFSVEIHFGLTEFQARIKWVQNGETKYGPATIVYNERGHRTEEDEPDFYPEDDALTRSNSSRTGDRRSSQPTSRARTPVDGHPVDSSRRSSRVSSDTYIPSANGSSIPEVSRVPSTRPANSNPTTPSRSAYASLHDDKDDRRRSVDRDSHRDRDRDSARTRSNRSSLVPSAPGSPSSFAPPSIHSIRSRGHTPTPTPGSPGLQYVDPPPAPLTPKSAAFPSPPREPASLWDNATPTATAPPEGAGLSRHTSNASAFSTAKSISIFGEDPKSAFAFSSPPNALNQDKGMPGGLFDEPVDNAGTSGWGVPPMSAIPRSVSISSRKTSSLKGSPAVSRAPSGQGKVLSPLNPAAQQSAAVDSLAAVVSALNDPPTTTTNTLPKIDTNVSPLSALSSAAPSAMGSGLTTPAGETPATPIGGASEVETSVSVTGSAKKKKKKSEEAEAAARKAREEAEEAARQAEALKAQQEAEEAVRKAQEEERRKAAEAEAEAAAEAKRLQEEEERRRQEEEEQRLKEEEEAKRKKEEEEAAKAAKKKPSSKKEERERKKREEQERKEREKEEKAKAEREEKERKERAEKERKDREEQERLVAEEKKRQEEEAQRKADEARVEQERIAEEARKRAESERLEQERIAEEEERKRKEEERLQKEVEEAERMQKKEEELRREEERIFKELADLEKQEEEAKLQEEKERKEREEEERRQEERARNAREEEMKRQEEEALREREKRAREREERERIQKAERERQSKSLGFGGWGGKLASSLFGGTSAEESELPPPPSQPWLDNKQDLNENASGWGSFGAKKKPSVSSLAKSITGPPPLSRKPSQRSFKWGNAGSTTTPSAFDFAAPTNNTVASLFGGVSTNYDESQGIGMQDIPIGNPVAAAEQEKSLLPPLPPPKEDGNGNPPADPWDIEMMATTAKEGSKPGEDPARTSTLVPETAAPAASKTSEEEAMDDPWGFAPVGKKKGKKGKGLLDLGGSEQPTREPSPAPGTPAEDAGRAPGQETTAVEDETGGGKKKGKADSAQEAGGADTPAGTEGGGADNLQDQLNDLLGSGGGEDNQVQTADAAEEWGVPVKQKKKKKKGANAVEDDNAAAPSPIEAGASGGDNGFMTQTTGKKKKKSKK
ncbi:hypothetical protein H1R20_g4610, partial [Candolleomyces eurysporus]